jgi:hypothetical protein
MAEGLSPVEVGREAHKHHEEYEHEVRTQHDDNADQAHDKPDGHRHRVVHVLEASLLAVVTVLTAWSGFSAAKWSTDSRIQLAKASTLRTHASREDLTAMELRNFDSSTFQNWFSAFLAHDATGEAIAIRRFRPEFKTAFDAWRATNPETNPNAPPGPTYMPEYKQPDLDMSVALDHQADTAFDEGEKAGQHDDEYVRITVLLAAVLFLIGIGSTFRAVGIRYALVGVGLGLLLFAVVLILQEPRPPT